jgi:hypothetical protein
MAAQNGQPDWKAVAAANGIEDPLRLSPGQLIDIDGSAGAAIGFSAGINFAAPTIAAPKIAFGATLSIN